MEKKIPDATRVLEGQGIEDHSWYMLNIWEKQRKQILGGNIANWRQLCEIDNHDEIQGIGKHVQIKRTLKHSLVLGMAASHKDTN